MSEIKSQRFVEDIKQFNCPNCGHQLTLINKKTRYVGCNYCGTVSDPKSEVSKIIMKLNAPSKYPPFSFLELGMKAIINGLEYRIIGRTRWQTTHMEYWKENSYEGYGTEKWVYDEWLLMGERFDYFYIVEDAEGFYISKNIVPEYPSLPTNKPFLAQGIDPKPNQNQPLTELGSAKVVYFEGETTYQIKPGDTIHFASYKKNSFSYVIEWRTDEDNPNNQFEIKEIEFFEEKKVPISTLEKWFSHDPVASDNIFKLFKRYLWTKKILGWSAVICLILAIVDYQPYVLNVNAVIKRDLIKKAEKDTIISEQFIYDSVYVQEVSGEKTFPLTQDMLVENSEYSELKDPNLEFAVLSFDTTVNNRYQITFSNYKTELLRYPVSFQANKNYYFNFDSSKLQVIIADRDYYALDTVLFSGWRKWEKPLEGYAFLMPIFSPNSGSEINISLAIQKEIYSSFGMLISSFVLTCLWILYLPISEWVFRFKENKK